MSWLAQTSKRLLPVCSGPLLAQQEALWLASLVTELDPSVLFLLDRLDSRQEADLEALVRQRESGVPLGYVVGWVPFGPLSIIVDRSVLIPRIETEAWCTSFLDQELAECQQFGLQILDLCTGSGAIGLLFAAALPNCRVLATDVCPRALGVAKRNLELSELCNVELLQSDMFARVNPGRKFDLIFSNPPYVTEFEYNKLDKSVREHEPKLALVGGLEFYKTIAQNSGLFLYPRESSRVIVEIGSRQAADVDKIFSQCGFVLERLIVDDFDLDRAMVFSLIQ